MDGRTELILTPVELLDRLAQLVTPPRLHKHRYCGVLARIYECLPLLCPRCGAPMRIIAFVLDRSVVERILRPIGEPTDPPAILPARSPSQGEIAFDQTLSRPYRTSVILPCATRPLASRR